MTFSPTSAILPSFTRMEPLKVPLETVITVAFLNDVGLGAQGHREQSCTEECFHD